MLLEMSPWPAPHYTGKVVATADVIYILDDWGHVHGSDNSGTYTYRGKLTSATDTDDPSLDIGGTISAALGANDSISIYDGGNYLGDATVSGTTWSFYDSRVFVNGKSAHTRPEFMTETTITLAKPTPSPPTKSPPQRQPL